MTAEVRWAYEAAGAGWGLGPSRVYGRLAEPLLAAVGDVSGLHVLDVGSGAGLVARALAGRGAQVVGTDLAHSMLRADADQRPPAVVGDVRELPFLDDVFEVATAAFVLNHLANPVGGLREIGRVCRSNGALHATTFDGLPGHPAKELVDAVAARFGYTPPAWYDGMRRDSSQASDPEVLQEAACRAGWTSVAVERLEVRPEELTPLDLAGWRLGMAHLAGFVAGLAPARREELLEAATEALDGVEPLVLPVLLLSATRG